MKQLIQIRVNGELVNLIKRVLEHQGQYIGPLYCRFQNERHEVKVDTLGQYYIDFK